MAPLAQLGGVPATQPATRSQVSWPLQTLPSSQSWGPGAQARSVQPALVRQLPFDAPLIPRGIGRAEAPVEGLGQRHANGQREGHAAGGVVALRLVELLQRAHPDAGGVVVIPRGDDVAPRCAGTRPAPVAVERSHAFADHLDAHRAHAAGEGDGRDQHAGLVDRDRRLGAGVAHTDVEDGQRARRHWHVGVPALRPELQPAAGRRVPLDEPEVPLAEGWPRDPPPGVHLVDLPRAHTRPEHVLRRLEDEEVAAAGLRVLPERAGITLHLEHASGHQVEEEQVLPRRPLPEQIARRQEGDEVARAREVRLDALTGAVGDLPELANGGIDDEYLPADRAVAEEVGTRLEGDDRPYLAGHELTGARADAVVGAARQPEESL